MVVVATAEAEMAEGSAAAGWAAATVAGCSPRQHSTARRSSPSWLSSCTRRCRRPSPPRDTPCRPRDHTRPTPTPAPRRARSRCHAPQAAPPACTAARRTGCTAPARRPTSRSAGSHPSRPMSCRTPRTGCHTPSPARSTAASTGAATAWVAARAAATVVAMVAAAKVVARVAVVMEAARAARKAGKVRSCLAVVLPGTAEECLDPRTCRSRTRTSRHKRRKHCHPSMTHVRRQHPSPRRLGHCTSRYC